MKLLNTNTNTNTNTKPSEYFMQLALEEAGKAENLAEIPVGAIITFNNEVIAAGHNLNRKLKNPTRHAEIIAIENACQVIKNERLEECNLYVTKEPCAMCAGAIIHARIKRLFIGSRDVKYGACGTVFNICGNEDFNHKPEITFGILKTETTQIIQTFFKKLRNKI